MSTIRQDAWSDDEDLLLAETVMRHIREGSTQLVAFEEVGKALSRTSAACGFRWNSLVRKRYENAIYILPCMTVTDHFLFKFFLFNNRSRFFVRCFLLILELFSLFFS